MTMVYGPRSAVLLRRSYLVWALEIEEQLSAGLDWNGSFGRQSGQCEESAEE